MIEGYEKQEDANGVGRHLSSLTLFTLPETNKQTNKYINTSSGKDCNMA